MKKRVSLAGLFHETHTFLQGRTTLADFTIRRAEEIREYCDEDSPLAGALQTAESVGWEVLPVMDLRANPGPTVLDEVVDFFWNELELVL